MKLRAIEIVAAILAILVSLLALGVSFWATSQAKTQARLSVRPYVVAAPLLDESGGKIGLYLSNAGIGPAIIKDMSVTIGGRSYKGLGPSIWPQFIQDVNGTRFCYRTGWPAQNAVLRIGADDPLLTVAVTASPSCKSEILKILAGERIYVHVSYESIYEDAFSFDGDVHMNDSTLENVASLMTQLEINVELLKRELDSARKIIPLAPNHP
jgi:hypothetical protein